MIDENYYDAVSAGELIEKNTPITVLTLEGSTLVVVKDVTEGAST